MVLLPDFVGNPFSTRYTRPGAICFQFDDGESEATLIDRLHQNSWWGQIVGPHGSGKSTLLEALLPALKAAGRKVRPVSLRQGDRDFSVARRDWRRYTTATQLVIDGYEQLGRFARWRLERRCRRCGVGLLVSTHRDVGLPTIFVANPSVDRAMAVVRQLLPPGDCVIHESDIRAAWDRNHGNLREMLFSLYDLFEQRRLRRVH